MKKNIYNKRKKNILTGNITTILILFFFIIFFFFVFFNFTNLLNKSRNFVQIFSDKYQYNLLELEISKLDFLDEKQILKFFSPYKKKSIFLLPIKDLSEDILKIKWVKNIEIKSNYKNLIYIKIEEEIPMGIYKYNEKKMLFSENLIILDLLKNISRFDNLILFYGENSINNAKDLMINFDANFKKEIIEARFINNRRWDIQLSNSILLKLPENNIKLAIKHYNKIYKNFSNKELNAIKTIDLRIKNKALIKYLNN